VLRGRRRAILVLATAAVLLTVVAVVSGVRGAVYRERIAAVNRAYPQVLSPNRDTRPGRGFLRGPVVDCVVVHATAGNSLEEAVDVLTDPNLPARVSAHYVVGKDGTVVQLVPIEERAWHAGASTLKGRPGVNAYSIGIEIVNRNDGIDPYTAAQYRAVADIIRRLRTCYRIPDDRIVSHAAIALPHGRKSDPRGFDFAHLRRRINRSSGS